MNTNILPNHAINTRRSDIFPSLPEFAQKQYLIGHSNIIYNDHISQASFINTQNSSIEY